MDYMNIKIGKTTFIQHNEYSKILVTNDNDTTASVNTFDELPIQIQERLNDAFKIQNNPDLFFKYSYSQEDNCIVLEDYIGPRMSNVIIPSEIDGLKTIIGSDLFFKKSGIKNLFLPDTITSLPEYFCLDMVDLKFVYLSSQITKIPSNCFNGCISLNAINLENIKEVDDYGFLGCKLLKYVKLENIETIGFAAFSECESLIDIKLLKAKSIDRNAFEICTKLQSVELNPELEIINSSAFAHCYKLNCIKLPPKITKIEKYAFCECNNLDTINFPDTLEEIGESAFYATKIGGDIYFPKKTQAIGSNAFTRTKIKSIHMSKNTTYNNTSFPLDGLLNINYYEGNETVNLKELRDFTDKYL